MTLPLAIDPVLLLPPASNPDSWVIRLRDLGALLTEAPIRGCWTQALAEALYLRWATARVAVTTALQAEALTFDDLLRAWDEVSQRLVGTEGSAAALSAIETAPAYVAPAATKGESAAFVELLGDLALMRRRDGSAALVMTELVSWTDSPGTIELSGSIDLLQLGDDVVEPEGTEAALREFLIGCCTDVEIMKRLLDYPGQLVRCPALGLTSYWLAEADGLRQDLAFVLGERCIESMLALGYDEPGQAGRARSCLRAMAFVAAGRAEELRSLEPHAYRTSSSGGAPPHRDSAGRILQRGWLFQGPDAHRLYWWSGEPVELVGVAPHDDPPPL